MNPRSLKELLNILQLSIENNGIITGMCGLVYSFKENGTYNFDEYCIMLDFIQDHKETKGINENDYLFPKGESKPRIEFLKQEISKV